MRLTVTFGRWTMSTILTYLRRNHHEGCHLRKIIKPYGRSTGYEIFVIKYTIVYIQFIVEDKILQFINVIGKNTNFLFYPENTRKWRLWGNCNKICNIIIYS